MLRVWSAGALAAPAWTVNESDAGLTCICCEVGVLPVIVIVKSAVAVFWQASLADSVNLDEPAVDGVPAMECDPSEFAWMLRPAGSAPLVTVKAGWGENGVTQPPTAIRTCGG
jgi:hypothetical protein